MSEITWKNGYLFVILDIIGNLLMNYVDYLIETGLTVQYMWNFIYVTVVCFIRVVLVGYIKNEPNYKFLVTGKGKPQFLKLQRPPLIFDSEVAPPVLSFLDKGTGSYWGWPKI